MKEQRSTRKKVWEVDPDYRRYVSSHHPEAIEFIKRNAAAFQKKGNVWLDIQDYSVFPGTAPDGSNLPGAAKVILFKTIVFDVFPRKMKPDYREEDTDYNRYITWKTATEDIRKQRSEGNRGERWIVECLLDAHRTPDRIKKVLIPLSRIRIENPAFSAYLKSQAYQDYRAKKAAYEAKLAEYRKYRRSFQEFSLPDGTVKRVLLYNRPEEKYEMLRSLGVSETEIQASRQKLVKPEEPLPPPAPPREITKAISAHEEERTIPGKWVWRHTIQTVHREKQKRMQGRKTDE